MNRAERKTVSCGGKGQHVALVPPVEPFPAPAPAPPREGRRLKPAALRASGDQAANRLAEGCARVAHFLGRAGPAGRALHDALAARGIEQARLPSRAARARRGAGVAAQGKLIVCWFCSLFFVLCAQEVVWTEGETRTCTTLLDKTSGEMTEARRPPASPSPLAPAVRPGWGRRLWRTAWGARRSGAERAERAAGV